MAWIEEQPDMKWTPDAEAAIKKVPFFVRKRVRARVEADARKAGHSQVSLSDVRATQNRFLKSQANEIKGYQVETCFGPGGCPNRAHLHSDTLVTALETMLSKADLLTHLKTHVEGPLKFHHEFRVAVADCPNACSQPQIRDIGIIAACLPVTSGEECTGCEACMAACEEKAITLDPTPNPCIDTDQCLACGQCIEPCPTETLVPGLIGYRILMGGKLGRHPRLAMAMPGYYTEETVLAIVSECLDLYRSRSTRGQRFAALVTENDVASLAAAHPAMV